MLHDQPDGCDTPGVDPSNSSLPAPLRGLHRLPQSATHPNQLSNAEMAGLLLLSATPEDPDRQGLKATPARYAKAMTQLLSGYHTTPEAVAGSGVFSSESNGLVSVREVEFYSLCEHHMLPFWGKISDAYYPGEQIVGLSKIPRLINMYARRLQVQERLTQQVADALFGLIKPRAVVVRATAQHLCMMMRGVEKQRSETVTEAGSGLSQLSDLEISRLYAAL